MEKKKLDYNLEERKPKNAKLEVVLGIYKIIKKKKEKKKKDLKVGMRRDWIVVGPLFEGEGGEREQKQLTGSKFPHPIFFFFFK